MQPSGGQRGVKPSRGQRGVQPPGGQRGVQPPGGQRGVQRPGGQRGVQLLRGQRGVQLPGGQRGVQPLRGRTARGATPRRAARCQHGLVKSLPMCYQCARPRPGSSGGRLARIVAPHSDIGNNKYGSSSIE